MKIMVCIVCKLIEALESHVTTMRGTLRKKMNKGSKSVDHKTVRARTASMAVEVCRKPYPPGKPTIYQYFTCR